MNKLAILALLLIAGPAWAEPKTVTIKGYANSPAEAAAIEAKVRAIIAEKSPDAKIDNKLILVPEMRKKASKPVKGVSHE